MAFWLYASDRLSVAVVGRTGSDDHRELRALAEVMAEQHARYGKKLGVTYILTSEATTKLVVDYASFIAALEAKKVLN